MENVSTRWFADPAPSSLARSLWLRSLGLIFFSAFYSLWFQIHGLIGPSGILPAGEYLQYARQAVGAKAYWWIPSLLWLDSGRGALTALVVTGAIASVLIVLNVFPRTAIAVAMICFLSFVSAAQDFSGYQSDGMLLEAAFFSLFLGSKKAPPTRASVFMLQWLWFRIYFESGLVKLLSGEEQWRNLTAMDKYYENGPLPTWLGWYVQHWPHTFHAFSAAATLIIELLVVWLLFIPSRKAKLLAFAITTLFAVMTRARFELEFQGTRDGRIWIAYPFRYKPQDPQRAPGIYAPYQPRFEWNLWFASLGTVSENPWVMATQERLRTSDPDVLTLFASNPFAGTPPKAVRVVEWQYWFTTREERARTGAWWNRRFLGDYAPVAQ